MHPLSPRDGRYLSSECYVLPGLRFLLNKTLKSALANAENNAELSVDTLVVKSVMVDEGPTMRRTMPRARGSANMIRKRTSHITVILADQEG